MTPVIQQSVRFRVASRVLFQMYLDSKKLSQSTGAPARISRTVGGRFTAFGGAIEGKNLLIVPGKQVVQLWRAKHWKKEDASILVITFHKVAGGAQVDVVDIGVPHYDQKGVRQGWPKYYWRPWKRFLAK